MHPFISSEVDKAVFFTMFLISTLLYCLAWSLEVALAANDSANEMPAKIPDDAESLKIVFSDWKERYGKTFDSTEAEQKAFAALQQSVKEINEHNAKPGQSWFQTLTELSGISYEEFLATKRGHLPWPASQPWPATAEPVTTGLKGIIAQTLKGNRRQKRQANPASLDYRTTSGYVTSVKDQQTCGSCYLFAANGGFEARYYNKIGRLTLPTPTPASSVSAQQMLECTCQKDPIVWNVGYPYNLGCSGGWIWEVYNYLWRSPTQRKAIKEGSYAGDPYKNYVTGNCQYQDNLPASSYLLTSVIGTTYFPQSEADLEDAVVDYGPIAVPMNALPNLANYGGGVYNDPACTAGTNHAVLVVGYNNMANPKYWIAKNSWGAGWGDSGYLKIEKNAATQYGRCGIGQHPTMPRLDFADPM